MLLDLSNHKQRHLNLTVPMEHGRPRNAKDPSSSQDNSRLSLSCSGPYKFKDGETSGKLSACRRD